MEEARNTGENLAAKPVREAFRMVGSVLYFGTFCLDQLGQPLFNENPQLTEGWEIPKYPQVFGQVMAQQGQEVQIKEKRPKPCCFNCGAEDHQLRDCPKPKDSARISEKRKEFTSAAGAMANVGGQRYHADEVEERFSKYKPGILSVDLLDALGVATNTLPPFIYRMRELGYPPGWLKEAEMENSGLTLYDGNAPEEGAKDPKSCSQNVTYDVSQLVDFPGFNVPPPSDVRDDYVCFGSVPMQPHHWKEAFAAHLANTYPAPGSPSLKRRHESESTPQHGKKLRTRSDVSRSSDMDTDSDLDTPCKSRPDGFQFQPPLPPGSPLISTPPPLPPGTPPVTPTPPPLPKGTPPPTPPSRASPLVPAGRAPVATTAEESEDGLTLEELEEQQRLLWAALQNADSANSDSETPPPESDGGASPAVPFEVENEGEGSNHFRETSSTPASPDAAAGNRDAPKDDEDQESDDLIVLDEVSQENDTDAGANTTDEADNDLGDDAQENDTGKNGTDEASGVAREDDSNAATNVSDDDAAQENSAERNGTVKAVEAADPTGVPAPDDEKDPTAGQVTCVPHRSKFAEGIIPFEDTPEFTEVAEATGVYLRIRDLLKGSPRNMARNKK